MDNDAILKAAKTCLDIEAHAVSQLEQRLDDGFLKAVEIMHRHKGKVVICGIGKSGHIAQKMAATFCSTGTPAVFLHAGEARHGDLGIYHPGDPTILISKSGSTAEIVYLVPILKEFESPIISIVANLNSEIARSSDVVLDGTVSRESDPLQLAPTSSAVAALAWGDALASALMTAKNFKGEDFARFHPAGQLGRNLLNCAVDVMKKAEQVAWVSQDTTLREIVITMSKYPQGAACVADEQYNLLGIVTEGDIRRTLERNLDLENTCARDIMTKTPVFAREDTPLADALKLMEDRPSQIYVLPVLESKGRKCIGLLRLHDIYQPQSL